MATVFNYETLDPKTGHVVVPVGQRTREVIRRIGGRIIEKSAETVPDEWIDGSGSVCPFSLFEGKDRNTVPPKMPPDRSASPRKVSR